MNTGIYKITCKVNNKIYIGSSKNIELRWKNHRTKLNKGTHKNPYLQASWSKYKSESFQFEILEICEIDELLTKEQIWMDNTKCYDREIGFNNSLKSNSPLGYKHTEACKLKMSKIKKDKHAKGVLPNNLKNSKRFPHTAETKEKIKLSKLGEKNPMYGKVEDELHKINRMKNMLNQPRWNKGLTIAQDSRLKNLANRKGIPSPRAISHKLLDKETGQIWEENSLTKLAIICPLSISTLTRLKKNKCGEYINNKYQITW